MRGVGARLQRQRKEGRDHRRSRRAQQADPRRRHGRPRVRGDPVGLHVEAEGEADEGDGIDVHLRDAKGGAELEDHRLVVGGEVDPMLRSIVVAALTALSLAATRAPLSAQRPTSMAGRSVVYAPSGMVATSQPLASTTGLDVLRRGGNAIDAAVAAAAVLSVTEPHMTGIGGDMFAIVWLAKERKLVALNASGRAGSLMTRDALVARGFHPGVEQGVLSVTVPGALAGWEKLVRTYGRRTLGDALQPAIRYARDGFPVT